MEDPIVTHLTNMLLTEGYFDNEVDARRAAWRLVEEMERMTAEDDDAGAN